MLIKEKRTSEIVHFEKCGDLAEYLKADPWIESHRLALAQVDPDWEYAGRRWARIRYKRIPEGCYGAGLRRYVSPRHEWEEGWCADPVTLYEEGVIPLAYSEPMRRAYYLRNSETFDLRKYPKGDPQVLTLAQLDRIEELFHKYWRYYDTLGLNYRLTVDTAEEIASEVSRLRKGQDVPEYEGGKAE